MTVVNLFAKASVNCPQLSFHTSILYILLRKMTVRLNAVCFACAMPAADDNFHFY